jgi:hypothetical protein
MLIQNCYRIERGMGFQNSIFREYLYKVVGFAEDISDQPCVPAKRFEHLPMRSQNKFHDKDKLYSISFATVCWKRPAAR